MHQLYPALLRMPVAVQAERRGEEYVVSVPTYACKDELKQVVLDGIPNTSKPLSLEFFINPQCPSSVIPTEVTTIDTHSGEAAIAPEREVSTVVLEKDISEAGEHLSAAEVGLGNEPDSSA